jgi:hypothetical protein
LISGINNPAISPDLKIALANDRKGDFNNLISPDFHIDQSIRKNYHKIMGYVFKS